MSQQLSRRDLFAASRFALLGLAGSALAAKNPVSAAKASDLPANPLTSMAKELRLLSAYPLNGEALVHQLDHDITPTKHLFVRNNGLLPELARSSAGSAWSLAIDGLVERPLSLSLQDLKSKFKHYTYQLVLECGGNGRAGFLPQISGLQFTYGAVGCPQWTGVRLKDVLTAAGVKDKAIYLAYYGHDIHPSRDATKVVISRGFPLRKAWEDTTLLAFALNGKPLPPEHGYPLRLICPGFPGSASGKWLKRLWIRDVVHDGEKMLGSDYRVPRNPVAPGTILGESELAIIEEMPIKSLITAPLSGSSASLRSKILNLRGFAWCGKGAVRQVDVTYDYGQSWQQATLHPPANPFAWQRWELKLKVPRPGYYEIFSRASDLDGIMQPMVAAGWNQKGYLNNAMPRIALSLTA